MSRQLLALSPVQVQGAQFVTDYLNHPDYRLVAAFFLGWVFFSGLRHVWFSAFLRELMWHCKAIYDRLRVRTEGSPTPIMDLPHEKFARTHQSSSQAADQHHREQRDTLTLLLCMAFMLASLSSFLSLLSFYVSGSAAACAFVVAATTIASQAARVFGLLMLSLDLNHCVARPGELRVFWVLLGLGTVLSGVTVGFGTGHLVSPFPLSSVTLCFRKRFLPTSLASFFLNFVLELYIIIRSFSLMQPPRLKLSIVQDPRIIQAGSLLLFDLLVVVPNAIFTNLIVEFVLYSVGALVVLAAFNSPFDSFGQTDFVPSQLNGPSLSPHSPSRTVRAPEHSMHEIDISDRAIRINNYHPSAIGSENRDIEAQVSPSQDLRATWMPFTPPLNALREEATPISPPQPIEVPLQRTIIRDIVPPVVQWEHNNSFRREKILSYSSPVWATFGAPRRDESGNASVRPQISIEVTGSPTSSTGHIPERNNKVTSSSSILGSDIIRGTHSNAGKDRMRVHRSGAGHRLSEASSVPSSKWVTHQSWTSRVSAYPATAEDTLPPRLIPPRETAQPSRWGSFQSLKSKHGSRSSRSSKSRKSSTSTSMRSASAKAVVTIPPEISPSRSTWMGSPMHSATLSQGFSVNSRGERASFVRGPRPPPFTSRIGRGEAVRIDDGPGSPA